MVCPGCSNQLPPGNRYEEEREHDESQENEEDETSKESKGKRNHKDAFYLDEKCDLIMHAFTFDVHWNNSAGRN